MCSFSVKQQPLTQSSDVITDINIVVNFQRETDETKLHYVAIAIH